VPPRNCLHTNIIFIVNPELLVLHRYLPLARHYICYTVLISVPISLLKHSRNRIGELNICSRNERRRKIEATLVSPGLPFLILFCKVQRNNLSLLTWDWKVVQPLAYAKAFDALFPVHCRVFNPGARHEHEDRPRMQLHHTGGGARGR
jgi:hypothetical protein